MAGGGMFDAGSFQERGRRGSVGVRGEEKRRREEIMDSDNLFESVGLCKEATWRQFEVPRSGGASSGANLKVGWSSCWDSELDAALATDKCRRTMGSTANFQVQLLLYTGKFLCELGTVTMGRTTVYS
jgi:hypothetical protein